MSNPFGMVVVTRAIRWFTPWRRKEFYLGFAQSVQTFPFRTRYFLIDKLWFDTLSPEAQTSVYERERHAAYLTASEVQVGDV